MRRLGLLLVISCALAPSAHASTGPVARMSTTCSDFSNQAAAQRAHNTRDSDGDGIYCEDLPCPCLKPGQSGGGTRQPARRPSTFAGRCKRGILPDRSCSPGVVATTDVQRICTPGYSGTVRHVASETLRTVPL